jgi:hypothetical protein
MCRCLKTFELCLLDDGAVANICKAISKDTGKSVAKIATTKLKLVCFWIRHQHWTSREIGGAGRSLVQIKYSGTIDLLQQQKQDKDNWASGNKDPEYTSLTLDTATAIKVFDKDGHATLVCHQGCAYP